MQPVADSADELNSSAVENDPVAFQAIERQTLARGTVRRNGQRYAEVAYPIGHSVVLLSASLHDQLRTVSVVQRRVFIAGGVAFGFALLFGYAGAVRLAQRIRRLETAAERIAAGNFTSRSSMPAPTRSASWRGRSSACGYDSRGSTGRGESSSPTPRTSCERRSSR